jgi:outer membrane lipoprotein LolB
LYRSIFIAFAVLAITACGQRSLQDKQAAQLLWASEQQSAAQFNSWDIRARAVLRLKGQVYHIGIGWHRAPESFNMLLEAPSGQGVFRIESTPGDSYQLSLPDGRVYRNTTPEALLDDVIGWSLPINGLDYWIRGMPTPDSDYSHRIGAGGRTRSIAQDQWNIEYLDYFAEQRNPQLPRRISLTSEDLTVKLVIERWQRLESNESPSDLFPAFN